MVGVRHRGGDDVALAWLERGRCRGGRRAAAEGRAPRASPPRWARAVDRRACRVLRRLERVPRAGRPGAIPADAVGRLEKFVELLRTALRRLHVAGTFVRQFARFAWASVSRCDRRAARAADGLVSRLDAIVSPLFDALRFVAPIAWVPFAALWFGTGIGGPVLIIFSGAFPPCLINAYRGAKYVDPRLSRRRKRSARGIGGSLPRCCCRLQCPRSSPACE